MIQNFTYVGVPIATQQSDACQGAVRRMIRSESDNAQPVSWQERPQPPDLKRSYPQGCRLLHSLFLLDALSLPSSRNQVI